jgi:hypothetical protein
VVRKSSTLLLTPFGTRDAKRFGLAELIGAGLQVEVWDLSHFFLPAANELGIEAPGWVDHIVCSNIAHFHDLCATLTTEDVVILIGCTNPGQAWRGRKILRSLSTTPARLASVSVGQIPTPIRTAAPQSPFGGTWARVFELLIHPRQWKKIPQRLTTSIFPRMAAIQRRLRLGGSIRPLDHIWAGTMVSDIAPLLVASTTTVTYIHQLDYDLVLSLRASTDKNGKSAPRPVFIDSMCALHPDYLVKGSKIVMSIESYSEIICRALDEIEERLGTEVAIAVHPRASFGVMEPWYGGRTLIYGQIAELIADATVVIGAEGSTAFGLAAIFRRPLMLLGSGRSDSYIQGVNKAYAQTLDTPLIDLDAPELPPLTLDVNEEAYAHYVQEYVKRQGTPEEPFWSVVASEIVSGAVSTDGNLVD